MKVLDKMTVKMDLPSDVVIERLMELQGFCRNRDTMGELTEFWCLENGKFSYRLAQKLPLFFQMELGGRQGCPKWQ